jgi:hypothetical protein
MMTDPMWWILFGCLAVGVVILFSCCIIASGARAEARSRAHWRILRSYDEHGLKPTPLEKYNADKHQK